jgi:hypothetical protein
MDFPPVTLNEVFGQKCQIFSPSSEWRNLHFRVSDAEACFIFLSVYSHPLVDLFYDEYIPTQVYWYV